MTFQYVVKSVAAAGAVSLLVLAMSSIKPSPVRADDGWDEHDESKSRIGLEAAPVPLKCEHEKRKIVGLGSYIVNIQAECNGCHSAGPQTEYAAGGNPYLLPPVFSGKKQENPATYLGGGRDFGPLVPGSFDVVSRNLTPDKTGLPIGGHTFKEFVQIMRTGVDMDHLHPTCAGAPNASCVPFPFNGNLLQIMPWPAYQDLTEKDLKAIYEYLKAVPCIAGPPAPSPLHNDCT
jgi:hypothetical protein